MSAMFCLFLRISGSASENQVFMHDWPVRLELVVSLKPKQSGRTDRTILKWFMEMSKQ